MDVIIMYSEKGGTFNLSVNENQAPVATYTLFEAEGHITQCHGSQCAPEKLSENTRIGSEIYDRIRELCELHSV